MYKYKLNDTGYKNVCMMPSHWEEQRRYTVELYLSIPNEDILHNIQHASGVETCTHGLSGWYGRGANPANLGQWFGAYAKLYNVTGDYRLKEKVVYLADEWGKCAEMYPDFYNSRPYSYDKFVGGLLDMYEFLGYEKAKEHVSKFTDKAIETFRRDIERDGLQNHDLSSTGMIEWYTLPEQIYRAYQLFGDEKYKEFAKEWDYPYLYDKLVNKDFDTIGPRHAYSHVNTMSSAAKAYEVSGDPKYLTACKNAYDEITSKHIYATGGYGPAETLYAYRKSYLGDALKATWDSDHKGDPMYMSFFGGQVTRSDPWGNCEVSCCAWATFKFCNYMIKFTGEAKYGDWAEKMLVNGTGGQIPMTQDGKILYYASYFSDGALKSNEDRRLNQGGVNFTWQCCTGTWPQDVAEYANLIYYYDENDLYVSQYLPSKFQWNKGGIPVTLENYSNFPDDPKISMRVCLEGDAEFGLKLRVPSWANGQNVIMVNGEKLNIDCKPNTWAEIQRVWKNGDTVTIEYPYSLYFKPADEFTPDLVALCYGPLVLASTEMTILVGDVNKPEDWIKPVEGETNTFETLPGHSGIYDFVVRRFVPYHKIGEMEWYYMYNRIYETTPAGRR